MARSYRRRRQDRPSPARWLGILVLVGLAVVAGYLWRSFAPLPLAGPADLSGLEAEPSETGEDEELLELLRTRAEEAEAEADRLREERDRLLAQQARTEEELADLQIRDVLEP